LPERKPGKTGAGEDFAPIGVVPPGQAAAGQGGAQEVEPGSATFPTDSVGRGAEARTDPKRSADLKAPGGKPDESVFVFDLFTDVRTRRLWT
jgi:hypothetical protein